jgi:imidazole glycerol-phosphate synthase subunit HisH
MVVIIDYGVGNLGSIQNMLKKIGSNVKITNDAEEIKSASKIILPGVGNFDYGMKNLESNNLIEILNEVVFNKKTPILGICLGAQLMTKSSEEGERNGLSWFDAEVVKFNFEKETNLKVPHMGWDTVNVKRNNLLTEDLFIDSKFYFVHSYYIKSSINDDIMFTTNYGNEFVSGLNKDNIYAVQFHPEKSHKYGMKLMQNFVNIK